MTTTEPNPKRGGTNVVTNEVFIGEAYLTLQYALSITHYYHHTRKVLVGKMMQETLKNSKYIPVTWEMRSLTVILTVATPV